MLWESKIMIRKREEIEKMERRSLGLCWVKKGASRDVSGSASGSSSESR